MELLKDVEVVYVTGLKICGTEAAEPLGGTDCVLVFATETYNPISTAERSNSAVRIPHASSSLG
jgi:hypothetical protein